MSTPAPPPHAAPRRRGKTALVIALVAVLLGASVAGVRLLWPNGLAATAGQARPAEPRNVLDEPGPLTEADLAKVDAARLLDESLRALLTQPVLHTRSETIRDVVSYVAGGHYEPARSEGGFDFRSHDYAFHQVDGFTTMCVGGANYQLNYDDTWEESGSCGIVRGSSSSSTLELIGTVVDGVFTAGLTGREANAFLRELRREYPDCLRAGEPSLVEHDGKTYVRLPVTVGLVDLGGTGYGLQLLMWSFRAIGADWQSHALLPGSSAAMVSQVEAVYYLDPETLLPAYTESLVYEPETDPTAVGGKVFRVEYLWDGTVPQPRPAPGAPLQPPPLSWPVERLEPAS